jgi:hypothetical protein
LKKNGRALSMLQIYWIASISNICITTALGVKFLAELVIPSKVYFGVT